MPDENQNEAGFFQNLKNFVLGAGQDIARDESSGGKLGEVIRNVSDSRGAEPLWAAWRQGADELGQALKAFPDSIQAHAEPGGLFDPLYSDIVAAQDNSPQQPLPSPSQIANDDKMAATVHGPVQEAEKPIAMSPSEVANDGKAATMQEADRQAGNDRVPTPGEIAQGRDEKAWTERIKEDNENAGNTGNDQNARAEERSLADEQREQREQDRGRGGADR